MFGKWGNLNEWKLFNEKINDKINFRASAHFSMAFGDYLKAL